jgi:hypothetical protein
VSAPSDIAAYDALLTWCSERGSGSFQDFSSACDYLGLDGRSAMRALSGLGHVEFDRRRRRFASAPTALAVIPKLPAQMLLTGARPHGVAAELATIAGQSALDVDVSSEGASQFGYGPSTFFVEADPADASEFCAAAGICFAADAHRLIADRLPLITVDTATVAHATDTRFPHAIIDPHTFRARWDLDTDSRTPGLWLYLAFGGSPQIVLLDDQGRGRLVLDNDYGPYLMPRPSGNHADPADPIIEYRGANDVLVVNASAPLPTLHARAACLCSGRLPIRRDVAPGVAYQHYVNVDDHTAYRILQSLGIAT